MGVAGIDVVKNTYEPPTSTNTAQGATETPQEPSAALPDKVNISEVARNLATHGKAGVWDESSQQVLPVEAYSLPRWYAGMYSGQTLIDIKIGQPYDVSSMARFDDLSSEDQQNLSEYYDKLHQYFSEGLREHGIENAEDYYNRIVRDPVTSEEVHQTVKQKLLADERAMELAEYFGISV